MLSADDVRDSMPLFQSGRGGSNPTSALQFVVRECSMPRAQELNRLWHSVLPNTELGNLVRHPKSIAYWADWNDRAYAVAIWTTPSAANRITNGFRKLELRRFAISGDAPPNTASRLLRIMRHLLTKKFPDLVALISYQAERYHAGTIYKAAGWKITNRANFVQWRSRNAKAGIVQAESPKIRWELALTNEA